MAAVDRKSEVPVSTSEWLLPAETAVYRGDKEAAQAASLMPLKAFLGESVLVKIVILVLSLGKLRRSDVKPKMPPA